MPLFSENLPQWENTGTEPSGAKKTAGWLANEKPPAEWFNWLFNRAYKCIEEIRTVITNSMFIDPMTTRGDTIYRNASNTSARLPLGAAGKSPVSDGTDLAYGYPDVQYYEASNNAILTANTERSTNNTSYTTLKNFNLKHSGVVRIKMQAKASTNTYPFYIAVDGIQCVYSNNTTYSDFSADVSLGVGNHVIQVKTDNASVTAYIRNVTINSDLYVPSNSIVD